MTRANKLSNVLKSKPHRSMTSVNNNQNKYTVNYTKAHHNQIAEINDEEEILKAHLWEKEHIIYKGEKR